MAKKPVPKVTAPKTYNPGKGRPKEHLAYLNEREMAYLRSINGNNMERGPRNLPSFPPDDAIGSSSNTGSSSSSGSKGSSTANNSPQNGGRGAGSNYGAGSGRPNSGGSSSGSSGLGGGGKGNNAGGGMRGAGSNTGPGSGRPGSSGGASTGQGGQRGAGSNTGPGSARPGSDKGFKSPASPMGGQGGSFGAPSRAGSYNKDQVDRQRAVVNDARSAVQNTPSVQRDLSTAGIKSINVGPIGTSVSVSNPAKTSISRSISEAAKTPQKSTVSTAGGWGVMGIGNAFTPDAPAFKAPNTASEAEMNAYGLTKENLDAMSNRVSGGYSAPKAPKSEGLLGSGWDERIPEQAAASGTSTSWGGSQLSPKDIYSNPERSSSALNSVINGINLSGLSTREAIDAIQRNMGLTNKIGRAGMMGTFEYESAGLNPRSNVGDKGTAYGLGQWRGERQDALRDFAKAVGRPVDDPSVQTAFAISEMGKSFPRSLSGLQNARTVEDAVAAMNAYEKPAGFVPGGDPTKVAGWKDRVARSYNALNEAGVPSRSQPSRAPATEISSAITPSALSKKAMQGIMSAPPVSAPTRNVDISGAGYGTFNSPKTQKAASTYSGGAFDPENALQEDAIREGLQGSLYQKAISPEVGVPKSVTPTGNPNMAGAQISAPSGSVVAQGEIQGPPTKMQGIPEPNGTSIADSVNSVSDSIKNAEALKDLIGQYTGGIPSLKQITQAYSDLQPSVQKYQQAVGLAGRAIADKLAVSVGKSIGVDKKIAEGIKSLGGFVENSVIGALGAQASVSPSGFATPEKVDVEGPKRAVDTIKKAEGVEVVGGLGAMATFSPNAPLSMSASSYSPEKRDAAYNGPDLDTVDLTEGREPTDDEGADVPKTESGYSMNPMQGDFGDVQLEKGKGQKFVEDYGGVVGGAVKLGSYLDKKLSWDNMTPEQRLASLRQRNEIARQYGRTPGDGGGNDAVARPDTTGANKPSRPSNVDEPSSETPAEKGKRPAIYYYWDAGINIPSPGDPDYTLYLKYLREREAAIAAFG